MVDHYRSLLRSAHDLLKRNTASLTLDEALFSDGGYRSILGVLKHLGGWAHVYRSYAFDAEPKHWEATSWPRGMRETIDGSNEYVDEVLAWIDDALAAWDADLASVEDVDEPRPCHWGATAPLASIVDMVGTHIAYHTGELNMLLSIARGEAWEWGEEVEENHIDTWGHGVRGPWMDDDVAKYYEERIRAARERRLRADADAG